MSADLEEEGVGQGNSIVCIGDIHRRWDYIEEGLARLERQERLPHSAILLGDMECYEPLDDLAAPLLRRGIAVHWIFGNHDYDGGPEMWENLANPARNPRTTGGGLHARVQAVGCFRIAGLGGTFRHRVWGPPAAPRLHSRADLAVDLESLGPEWSKSQRARLSASLSAMAIWPEDWRALAGQRADILVTHEAPESHQEGVAALSELARRMGARLLIHGHHHVSYHAVAPDDLQIRGVAAGWGVTLEGRVLWTGEPQRWIGRTRPGWRYGS